MAVKGMSVFTHQGEDYTINDPNNAPEFDATASNAKGDYVYYQGDLYRFNSAHAANTAWSSRSKTKVKLGAELLAEITARENADGEIDNTLFSINANGLMPMSSLFPYSGAGLTYTEAGNGYIHISGTQDGRAIANFLEISGDNIPDYLIGAKDAIVYIGYRNRTTNYMIPVDVYIKTVSDPSLHILKNDITMSEMVELPSDLTYIMLRSDIPESAGVELNDDMTICLLKGRYPNLQKPEEWLFAGAQSSLTETNLNNVYTIGFHLLVSDRSYTNKPDGYTSNAGFLAVNRSAGYWMQLFFEFTGNRIWKRRSAGTVGTWEDWQLVNNLSEVIKCEPSGLATLDLNNVTGNHFYLMTDSHEYVHKPTTSNTGFLMAVNCGTSHTLQIYYQFTGGKIFKRRGLSNGSSWEDWQEISGSGGTAIENTYNIMTSPQITTDTNGWLQAVDTDTSSETGKTDMTGPIMSMLNDTGYCHLGEGIFYVSGSIDKSTTTGYCVKLTDYSTIKDVSFSGSYSAITPTTEGTRNGVHFVGGYESTPQKRCSHCVIDNVIFRNFSGAGLLCDETSISPEHGLYATNLYFTNCYAGIHIRRYSEFHKFTNICTTDCYYGVINNGGNNVFTACTFRATNTAFYIDGTAPNSAHGTINGCTFCHTGSNAGSAITMEDVTAGFIVSACQFWYNSVDLSNCKGIAFSGCEFGNGITGSGKVIEISGGDTIMFTGCIFKDDPVITISNNSKVKFTGCFERDSGDEVTGQ